MRAIRKSLKDFGLVVALFAIAVVVGGYILAQQRLRFPILEEAPFVLKAEFSNAQAVTPGQGQTVRVSGVKIGDIGGVELVDGRAIVTMDIDPEYEGVIRRDARLLLRPKTGLKDMFIEVTPGSDSTPAAPEGWTIPVESTLTDVDPDEILAMLDADTRDYLQLLVQGAGGGLEDRGEDLREVFRRFEPTHRDLARVTREVARRRANLRRVISSLNALNTELAGKDESLSELVGASAQVFRAFASEEGNVSEAVERLPGALAQTTDTLRRVERFAHVLRPAADDLRPVARALDDANEALIPLAREGAPILREAVRPFTREARPLVRDLTPAAGDLAAATPDLERSFVVLNHLLNLVGFNRDGREGPDKAGRDEGYLFWIAWLNHNAAAVFASADAHGPLRALTQAGTCSSFKAIAEEEGHGNPLVGIALQGLSGVLTDERLCG